MRDKMPSAQAAAIGFVRALVPGGRVAIVSIGSNARVLHPLDEDLEGAQAAIRSASAFGGTALWASRIGFDDVLEVARASGVAIYTVLLTSPADPRPTNLSSHFENLARARYDTTQLAQETGGRAFFPGRIEELAGVYHTIATELALEYTIGYAPAHEAQDHRLRRIVALVPDRPDLRVRTRTGYTMPRVRATVPRCAPVDVQPR